MSKKIRIVIIGATSGIAEQCARIWAAKHPTQFVLVGRNLAKLEIISKDLIVRSTVAEVTNLLGDFEDPVKIQNLVKQICDQSPVDVILIAHGSLPDQQLCQANLSDIKSAIGVNAISPVLFAEAFATFLEKSNHGTLAVIGSVAGDRGRKSNYIYGSAKGLVTRYVQGLQHRLSATSVKVILIKPGPTDTPMTAHLKRAGVKLDSPKVVAQCIVEGIEKGSETIYAPRKWWLIMMIIRHLPRAIFNKMNI